MHLSEVQIWLITYNSMSCMFTMQSLVELDLQISLDDYLNEALIVVRM